MTGGKMDFYKALLLKITKRCITHPSYFIYYSKKILNWLFTQAKKFFALFFYLNTKKNLKFSPQTLVEEIFELELIRPSQIKEEILELLKILEKEKPKIILEIGTEKGGTLFLFSQVTLPDGLLISVDLPKGKFGGGYSFWRVFLYKFFAKENQKIVLIRKDSHLSETFNKVKNILKGRNIDFLFIDGDHTYQGVKKDFEIYGPLVKRGIIAFHDIVEGPKEKVGGVPEFWKEIKEDYQYKEIIKDKNQKGYGIGILFFKLFLFFIIF